MNARTAPPMDKATFWRFIARQERRFELVDGVPRMLPHVTRHHDRIVTNIVVFLATTLDRGAWDIASGDFAIETGERSVRFADVMVHPFIADDPQGRSTVDAALLVEVLSSRTAHVDFGEKLAEYRALDGVGTYVICAQDKVSAWAWSRDAEGQWPEEPAVLTQRNATIGVPRLGIELPLSEVYARVPVPDGDAP